MGRERQFKESFWTEDPDGVRYRINVYATKGSTAAFGDQSPVFDDFDELETDDGTPVYDLGGGRYEIGESRQIVVTRVTA